jgi:hypothetical protein
MRAVQSLQHAACNLHCSMQHASYNAACGFQRSMRLTTQLATLRRRAGAYACVRSAAEPCGGRCELRGHPPRRQANKATNLQAKQAQPERNERLTNSCHCCTCCKTARRPVTTLARCGRSERDFDAARSRGWWFFVSVVLLGLHWPSLVVVDGAYRMRGTTVVACCALHAARRMVLYAARCRRRRAIGAAARIAAPDSRRAGSCP